MRKPWKLEAVRAIAPEDIPKPGPDFSDLIAKLKETRAAGSAIPEGIKLGTIRRAITKAVLDALNSAVSVTFTDGTVYVELVPVKERKAGAKVGAKRGRKPKAAENA